MRIAYFGNGARGIACFDALLEAGHDIAACICHTPDTDLARHAGERGVKVLAPARINDPEMAATLHALNAELFVLSGYNRILRRPIIGIPPRGCLNLHGGKLPEYRGCAPINWQIINGETTGGCAVLFVDEGIDTGDIVEEASYPIGPDDTAADVIARQLTLFPPMLLRALAAMENGTLRPRPQDPMAGGYYTRRYPRDGEIHWARDDAARIRNLIRALPPPDYPGAFTWFQGRKLIIARAEEITPPVYGIPGRVPLKRPGGIVVCCRDRALLITSARFEEETNFTNPAKFIPIGADLGGNAH